MARSIALVWCILSTTIIGAAIAHEPNKSATDASGNSDLVVHEWGTFTTFSGSDGVFMEFRPLDARQNDLPDYVLDRGSFAKNPLRALSKNRLRGRVRMETPVIYFYTDQIRSVDVRVDFEEGLLTEFYPPVRNFLPAIDEENIFGKGEVVGKSSLNWGTIDLIPTSQLVPNLEDENVRRHVANSIVNGLVPHAPNEQHYAAARDTDAALVHLRDNANTNSYFEKFLFYRGVGRFQLPISTQFNAQGVALCNSGSLPINSAILIDVNGESIQASQIANIRPGQSLPFSDLKSISSEQLAERVRECLVAEGLYAKEAAAMVATWQNSWFTENGMRVLYLVPAPITDALLPLHITPPPQKMLRVLVGRMEILSPESEREMATAVAQSATSRAKHLVEQKRQGTNSPYAFPEQINRLGRMAEPALARVASIAQDNFIRNEAELLINELRSE